MEDRASSFTDTKPTSTRIYLESGGREKVVQRLNSSFKFANDNILAPSDRLTVVTLDMILANPEPRVPGTSTKGFFDGVRPKDEADIARAEGIPREAIMSSAGV